MPDGNHYKILIADDREDNLGLLREWLSAQDYYVRCARDGREALDLARQDPPDLVLVDKVMPEVDGLSVARQLKQLGLDPARIPHGGERLTVADIETWIAASMPECESSHITQVRGITPRSSATRK